MIKSGFVKSRLADNEALLVFTIESTNKKYNTYINISPYFMQEVYYDEKTNTHPRRDRSIRISWGDGTYGYYDTKTIIVNGQFQNIEHEYATSGKYKVKMWFKDNTPVKSTYTSASGGLVLSHAIRHINKTTKGVSSYERTNRMDIIDETDFRNVTSMASFSDDNYILHSVSIPNTGKCTNFSYAFRWCENLHTVNLPDMHSAKNMAQMFAGNDGYNKLKNISNFSGANIAQVVVWHKFAEKQIALPSSMIPAKFKTNDNPANYGVV